MAAADDYPADGAIGGTAELPAGTYERMCAEIDQLRALINEQTNPDIRPAIIALAMLRIFANQFGPDPYNDEPDMWVGSGADHAAQLYNILEAIDLHP